MGKLAKALVVLALGGTAAAAEVPPIPSPAQGLDLGARVAWAFPAGNLAEGLSLSGAFTGALPLQLDVGYRFDRHFSAGLFFSWAPGFPNDCPAGSTCSGSSTRLGLEVFYTLDRQGSLRPWFGAGAGYEWLRTEEKAGAGTARATLSGFEWIDLQVGGDFAATPSAWFGPYFMFTAGKFADIDLASVGTQSVASGQQRMHYWLVLGLRGHYEL
jgi:hypothetical protein